MQDTQDALPVSHCSNCSGGPGTNARISHRPSSPRCAIQSCWDICSQKKNMSTLPNTESKRRRSYGAADVSSSKVQRKIALCSLVPVLAASLISYLGYTTDLALGVIFGYSLIVLNYQILSKLLYLMFRFTTTDFARVFGFVLYHMRFWIVVAILFIVIPKSELDFVIGTFAGILIPKMVMGYFVAANQEQEWWLKKTPTEQRPLNITQKRQLNMDKKPKLNNARLRKLNSAGPTTRDIVGQAEPHCIYFRAYQESEPEIKN